MRAVIKAAIVLHNMIVEYIQSRYSSDGSVGRRRVVQEHGLREEIKFTPSPQGSLPLFCQAFITVSNDIRA